MASESLSDAPPCSAGFTLQEWAFLFPSWPVIPPSLSGVPGPSDPAADYRKSYPVTPQTLLDALKPFPVTRAVARLSLSLGHHVTKSDLVNIALLLSMVPICTAAFLFDEGQFGRTQLVAGTAALFWNASFVVLFHVAVKAISRYLFTMGRVQTDEALNGLPWAVVVSHPRTSARSHIALKAAANPPGGRDRLLAHDPAWPDLCPCPLPRCAGGFVAGASRHALLRMIVVALAHFVVYLGWLWTTAVTFAPRSWSTWWTAIAACAAIACSILYVLLGSLFQVQLWNPGLLELLLRGHHRAVSLSLSSFLEAARYSLETGRSLPDDADGLHVALHQILTQVWQKRLDDGKGVLALFVWSTLGNVVVCSTITASTGSCITMWTLGVVGISLTYIAFELSNFAVSNAQVDAVGLLYAQARDELGLLLARSPRTAPGIREDLGYHEKVLAAQAEVGRYKARFCGFAVGYSVLRTLLATLFTLAVGLWSVLRSAGVFATVETFCPIR